MIYCLHSDLIKKSKGKYTKLKQSILVFFQDITHKFRQPLANDNISANKVVEQR